MQLTYGDNKFLPSSVQVGLFSTSRTEEQQEQEQDPPPKIYHKEAYYELGTRIGQSTTISWRVTRYPEGGHPQSIGWSPTIPWTVTYDPQDGNPTTSGWSSINPRMVAHHPLDAYFLFASIPVGIIWFILFRLEWSSSFRPE